MIEEGAQVAELRFCSHDLEHKVENRLWVCRTGVLLMSWAENNGDLKSAKYDKDSYMVWHDVSVIFNKRQKYDDNKA